MPKIAPVEIKIAVGLREFARDFKSVEQIVLGIEKIKIRVSQAAQRAAKEETKVVQQEAKKQERTVSDTVKKKERDARHTEDAVAKALEKTGRENEKFEKAKRKSADETAKWMERVRANSFRMEMADIKKRMKAEEQANEASMRRRKQFADQVGHRFGYGVTSGIHRAAGLATAAMGIMGGFGVADSVRERANMHGLASAIAIQGSKSGERKFSTKEVLDTATTEGIRTGRGTEEMLHGLRKFIDITGDLGKAQDSLKMISDYADASGSSLTDMSTASAELFASGTVKNAKELGDALGTFVEMGKGGAIELKDFAKDFAKITGTATKFGGGTQFENVATLGALGEIGKKRGGAKGPIQALTSVQAFGSDITGNFDKIQKNLKVKLRDKGGEMRSVQDIIVDVISATGGKEEKLHGLFGRQGSRAIGGSMATYRDALKLPGGNDKTARAAVIKEITDLSSKTLSIQAAANEAGERRAEADRQFEIAMEKLKVTVGERLLPEIIKLVPQLAKMTPLIADTADKFAKLVGWLAENPFRGLGAIVGAFLLKELALAFLQAGLSRGASAAVMSAGSAMGVAGGGVKGAVVGGAALGAAGVATAASVAGALSTVDSTYDAMHRSDANIMNDITDAGGLSKKLFTKTATPEDIVAAQAKLAEMKKRQSAANKIDTGYMHSLDAGVQASAEGAVNSIAGIFGGSIGNKYHDKAAGITEAKQIQDSKALAAAIDMLDKTLKNMMDHGGGNPLNNSNREKSLPERGGSH